MASVELTMEYRNIDAPCFRIDEDGELILKEIRPEAI